jgi:hypothetical protein
VALNPPSLEQVKFDAVDIGLEEPPFEFHPPDSRLRIDDDKALSKSVIRAKSALCDLKRKCCSLVLRGRDWVGGAGKNSSSTVAEELMLPNDRESDALELMEYRRPNVGVISGVGRPAMLTVTPEEERLYEMLLRRAGLGSSSETDLMEEISSFSRARFRIGFLDGKGGEMTREWRLACLMAIVSGDEEESSTEAEDNGLGLKAKERRPGRGLGVRDGDGKLLELVAPPEADPDRFSGVSDKGLRFKFRLDGRGFAGVALVMDSAGVMGVMGVFGGGTFSLMEAGEGSSSSSSSSRRVPRVSLEDEEDPRSLKESRLFPDNESELRPLP